MADLDELLAGQDPGVRKAIEDLCERAGTNDADGDLLVEAGRMINGLRGCLYSIRASLEVLMGQQQILNTQREIYDQLRLYAAAKTDKSE